jgi:hypothetical protein
MHEIKLGVFRWRAVQSVFIVQQALNCVSARPEHEEYRAKKTAVLWIILKDSLPKFSIILRSTLELFSEKRLI